LLLLKTEFGQEKIERQAGSKSCKVELNILNFLVTNKENIQPPRAAAKAKEKSAPKAISQ